MALVPIGGTAPAAGRAKCSSLVSGRVRHHRRLDAAGRHDDAPQPRHRVGKPRGHPPGPGPRPLAACVGRAGKSYFGHTNSGAQPASRRRPTACLSAAPCARDAEAIARLAAAAAAEEGAVAGLDAERIRAHGFGQNALFEVWVAQQKNSARSSPTPSSPRATTCAAAAPRWCCASFMSRPNIAAAGWRAG